MKNNFLTHALWVSVALIITSLAYYLFIQNMGFKLAELQYKKDYFDWQKTTYQKDLIRECQILDANKTNKNWGYKNCTDALTGNQPVFQD